MPEEILLGTTTLPISTSSKIILESALAGKGVIRGGDGVIRAGEGVIRVGQEFLMLPHSLSNFEIQKCYQNEPKFNGVYSRNNLPKIKNGACVINLDKYESGGTH